MNNFVVQGARFCHPWSWCGSPWWGGSWGSPFCFGASFGFGFSVGFGCSSPFYWNPWYRPYNPYYGYPYYSYDSCNSVYVGYPYVGYYSVYPYPYLSSYDDGQYDCDFYDGYYVRFGPYRTSYYVACSGYGRHAYARHHCHYQTCAVHGYHYYHVRDCPLCYPDTGSYAYSDVNVPDVPLDAPQAAAPAPIAEASPATDSGAGAIVRRIPPSESAAAAATTAEQQAVPRDEAFFASLKPAQLSFAMGMTHFKNGNYDEASESFYNASLEDTHSDLVKVFLGLSLFSVGEYRFSAEYLRLGLAQWPAFPRYTWSVRGLYGNQDDFAAQLALLEDEVRLNPANTDAALVLIFLGMSGASPAHSSTGEALDRVRALSNDPLDLEIAERYVSKAEQESGVNSSNESPDAAAPAEDGSAVEPAVQAFLASLELKDVPALPIH